ncbi:MAG: ASKHA domain-containing protein [Candidatus Bathyarchaeia archaeon]
MAALKIRFEDYGVEGEFEEGVTVLEVSRLLGVDLESICGGKGICGKCKVSIISSEGAVPRAAPAEERLLSREELDKGVRLACLLKPKGSLTVRVPLWSRRRTQRLQVEGLDTRAPLKPLVRKVFLELPPASLEDQEPDDDRLLRELEKLGYGTLRISPHALGRLPDSLRVGDWRITAVLHGDEVIDVEPGDTRGMLYGAAVDLGSTKIAYYLVDLAAGRPVHVESMVNPQRMYGEDVMTRMTYANRGRREMLRLHRIAVEALNELTRRACKAGRIRLSHIYEMVVVGNTVMHHLLHGFTTRHLSLSPYVQAARRPILVEAGRMGLKINPGGKLYTLPTIRSFVGADNVAVCLSTGIFEAEKPTLILDIGTNTEVDLGSREHGVYATSTPSGPAFEGWATKWGMTASEGAIERVSIDPYTYEVSYRTIGGEPPMGICGSGFIDALAELMKCGLIGPRPGFPADPAAAADTERLRKGERGVEFVLAWRDETGVGEDIVITQEDVNELVKAKAAIHAAITLLLDHVGVGEPQIDRLLLAGAFGSYMDAENAKIIGLIPELSLERIIPIGNAAGTGARIALINRDERTKAEEISRRVRFIELATHPRFVREYVDSMYLPHKDLERYPRTVEVLEKLSGKWRISKER